MAASRNPGPRLLFRSAPVHGRESLGGYLLRLSGANGYPSPSFVRELACLPAATLPESCDRASLASLVGLEGTALAGLGYLPVDGSGGKVAFGPGRTVSAAMLDVVRGKVCPACLREGAWVRMLWDIRPYVACHAHGCLLVDRCPGCKASLSATRPAPATCRCGASLLACPEVGADPRLVVLSELLAALAGWDLIVSDAAVPLATLDSAVRLAWFIAAHGGAGPWRSSHMSRPAVTDVAPSLTAAAPILTEWPAGLHGWLRLHERDGNQVGAGLRASFGPTLHRLFSTLRGEAFRPVHDEVRNWLSQHWTGGLVKSWSPMSAGLEGAATLSAKEAARRLGISGTRMARLIDGGTVRGRRRRSGSRTARLVSAATVASHQAVVQETLPSRVAAERLGITVRQVRRLVRSGILRTAGRQPDRRRGILMHRSELLRFEAALDAAAAAGASSPPPAAGSTLGELARGRSVSTVAVLSRIIGGDLPLQKVPGRDDRPLLDRYAADLTATLGGGRGGSHDRAPEVRLTVRETASQLGLSIRMVPVLVAAGCLIADAGLNAGTFRRRSVISSSVAAFHGSFVLSRELAAARNTSTSAVIRRLKALRINPVVVGSSADGISSVWRRQDVE